jgi:hypothetical protein
MAMSISTLPGGPYQAAQRIDISVETTTLSQTGHAASVSDGSNNLNNKAGRNADEHLLITSPYHERPHLLDLRTVDTANQLLAKALVELKCLREDYATAPYTDIFNWTEVIESIRRMSEASDFKWTESSFYIVVFRSRIPPTTASADLGILDKAAHAEANESGGFLK